MTCVAGFVEQGTVWMGADSAGVAGYDLSVRADQKLFRNGPMLFGFTSSFRMGQILRYSFTVPDHDPRQDIEKYMSSIFVDAVRECLKSKGFARKENEQEHGGTFVVGYAARLFVIEGDYQVGCPADGFCAVGCGAQIAHGALFALRDLMTPDGVVPGRRQIEIALQAAERFSAGVRGPFVIQSLPPPSGTA
jgi:ATP-dependent protease HslVU (ClpYQ) peptidase subunit